MSIYANTVIIEIEEVALNDIRRNIGNIVFRSNVNFAMDSEDIVFDYDFDWEVYDSVRDSIFDCMSSNDNNVSAYCSEIYGTDEENDVICDIVASIREDIIKLLDDMKEE